MKKIGINIYEKRIVPQVGYLQGLNRDARSTKHKILKLYIRLVIFVSVSVHENPRLLFYIKLMADRTCHDIVGVCYLYL